jgi:glutamate/aspartate transport system permease protein
MARGRRAASTTYDPIGSYLAVAVIYLVLVFTFTGVLKWVERKTRIPGFEMETETS